MSTRASKHSLSLLSLATLGIGLVVASNPLGAKPLRAEEPTVEVFRKPVATKKVNKIKSIKNAKSLVIITKKKKKKKVGSRGLTIQQTAKVNTLFYLSSSGVLKEVEYADTKGKSYTFQNEPVAVYNINQSYVMVLYGSSRSTPLEAYLIRKTDGRMFSLEKAGLPTVVSGNYKNDSVVKADSSGAIYYPSLRCTSNCLINLLRVDVSNPAKLRVERITPADEYLDSWSVDPLGNVMYQSRLYTVNQNYFRIRNRTGGLRNVGSEPSYPYWLGLDAAFYWATYDNNDYSSRIFNRIEIDGSGSAAQSVYATSPMATGVPTGGTGLLFRFADRIIIVGAPWYSRTEVYNPEATPRLLPKVGLSSVATGGQSLDFYYLAGADSDGNGVLLRINPVTDEVTPLVTPGSYTFYTVEVGSDNSVMYSALRMSDGKKVLGVISPTGTDTVLSAATDETIDLEPIN